LILRSVSYTLLISLIKEFYFNMRIISSVNTWAKGDWNYEPLIVVKLLKRELKIIDVAHNYRGRIEVYSKLSDWKQGLSAIKELIRGRFRD